MIDKLVVEKMEALEVIENNNELKISIVKEALNENQFLLKLNVQGDKPVVPKPVTIQWKTKAINVAGVWKPAIDFAKRIRADWELENLQSRVSIDAPVVSLFGNDDANVCTFACSEVIETIDLNARIREEDNYFYCHLTFFTEVKYEMSNYSAEILVDFRNHHFSKSLKDIASWWSGFDSLTPAHVPAVASLPLYSTWYQFHQNLELDQLNSECKLAKSMGYDIIIIDDGWQTKDSNRGYDFTGDWQPDRFEDIAGMVKGIQDIGMKVALWYSVPFCGVKSEAYKKFKGKFLTENHRWAPVFDPRFPEVREYLVNIYKNALIDWNLDGFKLDFIDDFNWYPETEYQKEGDGRDFSSVNKAVDALLSEVYQTLSSIKPDIFIEFRQKYVGPAMRKYGNMFRAFDCPGDGAMNRVRIADIKMLSGSTVPHADMVKWHKEEPLELAALHLINTFFGVPQLSMMLDETTEHHKMIEFLTSYWVKNKDLFLNGDFTPEKPLSQYPILRATLGDKTIVGVYGDNFININEMSTTLDVMNAKQTSEVVLNCKHDFGMYSYQTLDCEGNIVEKGNIEIKAGMNIVNSPASGILSMSKL